MTSLARGTEDDVEDVAGGGEPGVGVFWGGAGWLAVGTAATGGGAGVTGGDDMAGGAGIGGGTGGAGGVMEDGALAPAENSGGATAKTSAAGGAAG